MCIRDSLQYGHHASVLELYLSMRTYQSLWTFLDSERTPPVDHRQYQLAIAYKINKSN